PMPTPRSGLVAAAGDGVIYAVGGFNLSSSGLARMEAYNPKSNTWGTAAPLPTGRGGAAGGLVGGRLYVAGGFNVLNVVEAYDQRMTIGTAQPPMLTPRHNLAGGVVEDTIYAVGGFRQLRLGSPFLAVNEAFTPFLTVGIDIKPG